MLRQRLASFAVASRRASLVQSRALCSVHVESLLSKISQVNRADKIALIDTETGKELTYSELDRCSTLLAKKIQHFEDKKGILPQRKSIGAFHKPGLSFTLTMLASWKLGRTFVPLCTTHSLNEVGYVIGDSNVGTVVCQNTKDITAEVGNEYRNFIIEASTINYAEKLDSTDIPATVESSHNSDAVVIYTSGTTGRPKGVVHTTKGLLTMMRSVTTAWEYTEKDRILHFLPLYHVHGLLNKLLCLLYVGGTVEFLPNANAGALWERMAKEVTEEKHRAHPLTLFMAVPTVYAKMLEQVRSNKVDQGTLQNAVQAMKQLRLMVSGSAALPDVVMDEWYNLTGQQLLERYGMTEIGMALTNPYQPISERRKGFVGKPFPEVMCRIVDENNDTITTPNVPGELQVAGAVVFKHYLNKPEATRETFVNDNGIDWFKTGDISEMDGKGNFKILGRNSADIIKSSGYKISALEIERELLSHPQVAEAAVVAVPHDILGEMIVTVIVARPPSSGSLNHPSLQKDIEEFIEHRQAKYKHPKKYFFVDAIPRNHMGKVNKKSLLKDLHINP